MSDYPQINSKENRLIKKIAALARDSQLRHTEQVAVIYGEHLIREASKFNLLQQLLVVSTKIANYTQFLTTITAREIFSVSPEVMHKINCLDSAVDLVGLIRIQAAELLPSTWDCDCVVLEQIQDPGNLGTILRAARASGVNNIFISPLSVDIYNPKVLRASQGIQFALKIFSNYPLSDFLSHYRGRVLALSPHAASSLYQQDLTLPTALVLGNEGSGLTPEVLAKIAEHVAIPMPGAAESLNLAMAATVSLFEMSRQRNHI